MTLEIKLTDSSARLIRRFIEQFGREKLYREILKFFNKRSSILAGKIVSRYLSGKLATGVTGILQRRTGSLARSVVGRSELKDGVPAMRVGIFKGPALKYAAVQEFGTKGADPTSPIPTIRPKRAKALAIPQNVPGGPLTRAGVDRFGGPRNFPGELRFVPFRKSGIAVGGLYDPKSYKREQKKGSAFDLRRVKMFYLLVKEVDIEPVHYLRDGTLQELPIIAQDLADFLVKELIGIKV